MTPFRVRPSRSLPDAKTGIILNELCCCLVTKAHGIRGHKELVEFKELGLTDGLNKKPPMKRSKSQSVKPRATRVVW